MNQVNLLRDTLKQHLPWHGARLNFLALFLMALIRVRTVDLSSLSVAFRTNAKPESSYKRLQRFFSKFDLDLSHIAKTIVNLMNIPQPWVLSIDRTQWCFGSTCFNIFVLGIVHNGVAFPITWTMLEKKGNSNSCERMDLLDQFWEILPTAQVSYICGDREFIGKEWLHEQIPLKIKKHGRKAKSIFRYGLDYLRTILLDVDLRHNLFLDSLNFLSCT